MITRQTDWSAEGVEVAPSPDHAVGVAGGGLGFVVGGAEIYRALLPHCGKLYLTRVWSQVSGDTHLDLDLGDFEPYEHSRIPSGAHDDVPSEFVKMRRKKRRTSDQNSSC